ncbi:MAG: CapA family protein [Gammaproteobacteria bacterium]
MSSTMDKTSNKSRYLSLFLCGDVMTGRGIDQVLAHPGDPHLYEPYVRDARRYVDIAEAANGPIPRPVAFSYIWGDALKEFERMAPDVRIVNLETSVTQSEDYWQGKGINYRMHPDNIHCITSAGIDCCVLANNHVMDWGYSGLEETLQALHKVNIQTAGAGLNEEEAKAPAVIEVAGKGRVVVLSIGMESSGISWDWGASPSRPGVNVLSGLSSHTVRQISEQLQTLKRPGDMVIASIHWGGNWGYEISREQRRFAHQLIDEAGVDVIHGHSSHHAKGIEVYHDKPVIYGCGDFINDYEGIGGYEEYRDDLSLMYFVDMDPGSGKLMKLEMIPLQIRQFSLHQASTQDAEWLINTLHREGRQFNTRVETNPNGRLALRW